MVVSHVLLFLSPRDLFKSRVIVLFAGQLGHTPALGWPVRAFAVPAFTYMVSVLYVG